MIIANEKPIKIIGYPASTMAIEFLDALSMTGAEILLPEDFFQMPDKHMFQYMVPSCKDLELRHNIIQILDLENLDLVTFIHDSVQLPLASQYHIGAGSFIFPFCLIGPHSVVQQHCIIGAYSLIGHYSIIEQNTILRPGCMIVGESQVGKNCVLNVRVTVTNSVTVCDNVTLYAFSEVRKDIQTAGTYGGKPVKKIQ
jgi:bifunctional N-acetylglucosamine-1-phosphate-uridyltransferase/glucosamine-1-phosphate-acetyltransferase GlmU-like protein